jgi:hypothetical protein
MSNQYRRKLRDKAERLVKRLCYLLIIAEMNNDDRLAERLYERKEYWEGVLFRLV